VNGRLNEISSGGVIGIEDGERIGFIRLPTEIKRAETKFGNFEARAAEGALLDHDNGLVLGALKRVWVQKSSPRQQRAEQRHHGAAVISPSTVPCQPHREFQCLRPGSRDEAPAGAGASSASAQDAEEKAWRVGKHMMNERAGFPVTPRP
jgi:hypothetical protein